MALQSSGTISLNDIHVEAGGSSSASATINDTDIRGLISKGSGAAMSFSEWYGASNYTYGGNAIWGSRWITGGGSRYNQQGGYDSLGNGYMSEMQYDDFNTGGTSSVFGHLGADVYGSSCVSNGSRIVWCGQQRTSPWSYVGSNPMRYVTVASTGNASSLGSLAVGNTYGCSAMDTAGRGVNCPGETVNGNSYVTSLDYFQISTSGNASNFGTLPYGAKNRGATESTAGRLIFCGGGVYSSTNLNGIQYISSASGGTGGTFGSLTSRRRYTSAATNGTRALIMGGAGHEIYSNSLTPRFNINYVTIGTTGNATDFGNNTYARWAPAATSNGTRALNISGYVTGGPGYSYSYTTNNIEYSTISTLGNASSFGNLQYYARFFDAASGS